MVVRRLFYLEPVERSDTDVSFQLSFRKARERTPSTRADFEEVRFALVNDRWICEPTAGSVKAKMSPLGAKFFEALRDATIGTGPIRCSGVRPRRLSNGAPSV